MKPMKKNQRIEMEYMLRCRSFSVLWKLISTPEGLQRWLADEVTLTGDMLSFTWGHPWKQHQVKEARLLAVNKNGYVRFRWDDDTDDVYVELRIEKSPLTGDFMLHITDFAADEDVDDMRGLWDEDLQRMHRNTGV